MPGLFFAIKRPSHRQGTAHNHPAALLCPADIVMLKLLRFVVRLSPKERQVNGNIRINVRDIDQRFMNDERNAQFFPAFAAEGLAPVFHPVRLCRRQIPTSAGGTLSRRAGRAEMCRPGRFSRRRLRGWFRIVRSWSVPFCHCAGVSFSSAICRVNVKQLPFPGSLVTLISSPRCFMIS